MNHPLHEAASCRARFDALVTKARRIRDDAAAVSDYAAQEPLWLIVVAMALPLILATALAVILP